jgi:hypothetical protein
VFGGSGADAVKVAQQQRPAVGVQLRPAVVAVQPGDRRKDKRCGAGCVVTGEDAIDLRKRVVTGLMHEHRSEATDGGQGRRR